MVKYYIFTENVAHTVKVSTTIAILLLLIAFGEVAVGHESNFLTTNANASTTAPPITVGTSGTYTSLTNAGGLFAALDAGIIRGDIVATITSDINETGSYSLNSTFTGSLKIQSDGTTNTIYGTPLQVGAPLININGADNVTFDGGAGKLLTFKNATAVASINTGPVIQFTNGSVSCVVTNCNIQSNTLRSIGEITIGTGTATSFNSVTISNNEIRDVPDNSGSPFAGIYSSSIYNSISIRDNNIYNWRNYGVYFAFVGNGSMILGNSFFMESTVSAAVSQTAIHINGSNSHFITGNFIGGQAANCGGGAWANTGNIDIKGIYLNNITSPASTIQGNIIQNITLSGTGSLYGIQNNGIQNNIGIVIVKKNKIFNLGTLSLTGKIYGVYNSHALGEIEFSNNLIAIGGGSGAIYGFYDNSTAGSAEFYYNSINIFGSASGANASYAFIRASAAKYTFKDNILSNIRTGGSGTHYAISTTSSAEFNSNYNDFYVKGTALANWGGAIKATLAIWRTSTEMDEKSVTIIPGFASTVDLNIINNSSIANHGIYISSVIDDIDGFPRSASPGMGINQFGPLIKSLTLAGLNADKVYDGTTDATFNFSDVALIGKDPGDDVKLTELTGTFDDMNAGSNKTVTIKDYTLSGSDANKYILSQSFINASITAKNLIISAIGVPKVYDGTTSATVTLSDNRLLGDILTTSYTTAIFVNKNVGIGKSLTINGIKISGADALNYTCNSTATTSSTITKKTLTISAIGIPKVYDGKTTASVTLSDNRPQGDNLTTSYTTAVFDNNNVGMGKTITVNGISLIGADVLNYTFNTTATANSEITKRELIVSATGLPKIYDGTTSATVTLSDDRLPGDILTTTYATASFDNNYVGTGKSITVNGISINGVDAFNYSNNTTASASSDITEKRLMVSATIAPKVYDGTTAVYFNLNSVVLTGKNPGDDVKLTALTGTFADKNVGYNKNVTITNFTLAGTDASKYILSQSSITGTITAKALTINATIVPKVYDGTSSAGVTLSDNRQLGDNLTTYYSTASFDNKKVGTGKSVTINGIAITGTDAFNYTYNTTVNTSADIIKKVLIISATSVSKIYDGSTSAIVNLSDNRTQGDNITTSYTTATFDNKNVSTDKIVTVSGLSITGTDMLNYTFNATATTNSTITKKVLTISATGAPKVYDGNTSTIVILKDDHLQGDNVTSSFTNATFDSKNVGTGKLITANGISIIGTDALNYTYNTTANASSDITKKGLIVSATGVSKVYDGTTAAPITLTTNNSIASDVVIPLYTTAVFDNKNVGTGKPVNVSGISIIGADAGNYSFNTLAGTTANITKKILSVNAMGISKVYNGTTSAIVTLSDNRLQVDNLILSYSTAVFDNKNVGTYKHISVNGISITGTDVINYTYNTTSNASADITPKVLIISATGVPKIYDGTTTASVILSDNHLTGDNITTSYTTANFNNNNIGLGKPIIVNGISIAGVDASNYTYNTIANTSASIGEKGMTVSATVVPKVYDGTTTATFNLSSAVLTGKNPGDDVTLTGLTGTFADKNVGSSKNVTITSYTLVGVDASKYILSQSIITASITRKALTISATGTDKVYDGTTSASVTLSDDHLQGDILTNSYTTAAFDNKNVGTGKLVTIDVISIAGADAGNYTFNSTANTTANITHKVLVITPAADNKVYDGTDVAHVTLSDNHLSGDVVNTGFSGATFSDKNVADGKTVTVNGFSTSGTDAANYTAELATTTANITHKVLTITPSTDNKVYDGTDVALTTLFDNHLSGDIVSISFSGATFSDKNVADGKTVTVNGFSTSGADAANYTATITGTTANITHRALAVTPAADNKEYDGTDLAHATLSDNHLSGDIVSTGFSGATFSDKNVGDGKTVTVNGFSTSGADAANYTAELATTTANITHRVLAVTSAADNKIYDATDVAHVTLSDNHLSGDIVTTDFSGANFSDKNVGDGKTVTVNGFSTSGTDANNYTAEIASTTAKITRRELAITPAADNKVYDGNDVANVTLSDDHLSGDFVTTSFSGATFTDKNVANGKTVFVTGISITGADATNYYFNSTNDALANISCKVLTVSATSINKVYDGNTSATITLSDNRITNDVFTTAYATAIFNNKNVGTGKPVSVNGISLNGTDALNYSYNLTATSVANITSKELTITATGKNKVYDGKTTTTVTLSDNRITNDVFTASYETATFNNKNVGSAKPVTVTNISLNGTDAFNYSYDSEENTAANITSKILTVSAEGNDKVYDGNKSATVKLTTDKIAGDVINTAYTFAEFNNKNVADEKPVEVEGISISGTDAHNYTSNSITNTTADITSQVLIVSATCTSKIYDGTSLATVKLSDNRIPGDNLITIYTIAAFENKLVGMNKLVTVNGISITGADALNYTYNAIATTTANITSVGLPLIITGITANSKVYDGTYAATLNTTSAVLSGQLSQDVVTLNCSGATGQFLDKNVGTGKAVTTAGFEIGGEDAGNYTLVNPLIATSITPKPLDINPNSISKCYGTTSTFIGNEFTAVGLVGNDTVTSVRFTSNGKPASADIGSYDIVVSNAIGLGLTNYLLNYTIGKMTVISTANQPADFEVSIASVCVGTPGIVYRIPNDPSVTYNWSYSGTGVTIIGTTNQVKLDFSQTATSGFLSVTASNNCGTSINRFITITVTTAPIITVDYATQVTMTSDTKTGNQWYNTNGLITGATAQTYTATQNGNYYVITTGNCSPLRSNTFTITHVSIPEYEKPTISIYPNPNTGEFRVNFKAAGNEKLKMIQIYNKLGKAVYQAIPSSFSNDLTEWVSIKNQSVGIYILVLTTDNQRISRQIVITK